MQRSLRFVLVAAIVLSGVLLISAATLQSFGTIRLRVLLSLAGLGVGAFLALIQLGALETYRRGALGGMVSLAISQVCYYLLVWGPWTTTSILWRAWWVSFVVAAASALVLTLKSAGSGQNDFIERATPFGAIGLALLLIGLALFREFPYMPGPFYQALLGVLMAGSLSGSFVTWRRRVREQRLIDQVQRRLCLAVHELVLAGVEARVDGLGGVALLGRRPRRGKPQGREREDSEGQGRHSNFHCEHAPIVPERNRAHLRPRAKRLETRPGLRPRAHLFEY